MKPRHALSWSSASLLGAAVSGSLAAAPATTGITEIQAAPGIAAEAHLQDVLLAISLNNGPAGEPVAVLRGADGSIYVPHKLLDEWRLRAPATPSLTRGGQRFVRLDSIRGLTLAIDEATQSLAITAEPQLFKPTRLAYARVEPGEEVVSGTGAFLNYDVSAEIVSDSPSLGAAVEVGVFTRHGVGISNFVGHRSAGNASLIRLDSNWTIDDPAGMRSLRVGDAISRGGVGGVPMRFGGIQIARNFAVEPGFVTIPLPSLGGSAALPSVVDIYVNGALRDSRDVPPGPFEFGGLPTVSGSGDVQLVVRDLLGREMRYSQSYYSAPRMLARGLHDYAFEAGFLRRSFGRKSHDYGTLMVSATERYGLSDRLTGEVHFEATRHVQTAGLAAAMVIGGIGMAEVRMAGSRSNRGEGGQIGVSLERRSRSLSVGITAEASSKDFTSAGLGREHQPPGLVVQAFAGMPVGFGSVGVSYIRRDGRTEPDAEFAAANASVRLGRLGNLVLAGRKSLADDRGFAGELSLIVPLGNRTSAGAGADFTRGGSSFNASVQRSLPAGEGFGYRLAASLGTVDRLDGKFSLHTSFAAYDAQLTWVDGRTGVRLSTAGGFGMVGGSAFVSPRLDQSFALVSVGNYPNVRVYADNQLVGRTGRSGTTVIPRLRPFDRNKLSIDLADLPLDAEIASGERIIRPSGRHGVSVEFAARPALAAIVPMVLDDGSELPAGATVTLAGRADEWISAPGGDVYLTGLAADNAGTARWSLGRCKFRFAFAATGDVQPRLTRVTCRRIGS